MTEHSHVAEQHGAGPGHNWAGNYRYRAATLRLPTTVDELRLIVVESSSVSVLGSRHSFTDIADADVVVDLRQLAGEMQIDLEQATVTVPGWATYAEVAAALQPHSMALHNLASLPHISVAGAIATATHGSGRANGNLATAVCALIFVDAAGNLRQMNRSDEGFDGAVVSLGAIGPVLSVSLDVVPSFEISQQVYPDLPLTTVIDQLDHLLDLAYSVSIFTTFRGDDPTGNVWVKARVEEGSAQRDSLLGFRAAVLPHHPVPGVDPINCTEQLGLPGPWSDRLPHFRMGFAPSAGDEVQSEFFVHADSGALALAALRDAASGFADRLMTSEVRAIAADDLWMSPHFQRPSVGFHFTWHPDGEDVGALERAVRAVEAALAPYASLPHWGKVFFADVDARKRYTRFDDYVSLLADIDPDGVFRNEWWHRTFLER